MAELFADNHGEWGPSAYLIRLTRERCRCKQCLVGFKISEVRAVLDRMVRMELAGYEPPSPFGFVLDAARLNLIGKNAIDEWKRHESAERVHGERALMALIKKRLTPGQWELVMLAFVPVGHEDATWEIESHRLEPLKVAIGDVDGPCGAPLKNGGLCQNHRESSEARCKRHHDVTSAPATYILAGDGAELVEHVDERHALVRGSRAIARSMDEIAEALQSMGFAISPRGARRHLEAIYETIRVLPHVGLLLEAAP